MVEKLKSSLETLDPPECPHCRIEMKWVQSNLIQTTPTYIEHHFVCGTCSRKSARRDQVESRAPQAPPSKLSRTAINWAA